MTRTLRPIIILLLLAACSSGPQPKNEDMNENYGGILVMNQFQGYSALFPPSAYESSAALLGTHIFETLVGYDHETKELEPRLAESWTMNEDGTQYTFKIREDVYFHDDPCFPDGEGRQLTAEDVLYCLKSICEYSSYNRSSWLFTGRVVGASEFYDQRLSVEEHEVEGLKLLDDDEIHITLEKPNMEFIHELAHYGSSIYPRESKEYYANRIDAHPVGTGPFYPKVLRKNEVCIMKRNSRYWKLDESGARLPYLQGLKIGFEKSGSELINSVTKGLLHVVMDVDMIEDGDRVLSIVDSENSTYGKRNAFDLETIYLGFLNDEGVFQDARIRRAFGLAIDKEKISSEAIANSGAPGLYGLIPPAFKNYPYDDVKGFPLRIEEAKSLLEIAGYPNGEGFPVMTLQIQNRYKDVVVAQEIQRQILENLGVSLSITTLPRAQHFQRTEDRQAMLWLDNWAGDFIDPQNFLNLLLSKNTPEEGASFLNIYRYKNETFDSLVDEAVRVKDTQTRMQLYCKADQKLMDDAAIIPIYYEKKQLIEHNSVKGLNPPILSTLDLREVYLSQE